MAGPDARTRALLELAEQHRLQWEQDNARPLRELADIRERGGLPPETLGALKGRTPEQRHEDQVRNQERGF